MAVEVGFGLVTVIVFVLTAVTVDVDVPDVVKVLLELTYVLVQGHGEG